VKYDVTETLTKCPHFKDSKKSCNFTRNNIKIKKMDLNTLINARLEMMGNDRPSSSCSTHGDTRKEAIAQAIEFLQREYESNELDEPSEYGYRVNVEIFKKGKPRF